MLVYGLLLAAATPEATHDKTEAPESYKDCWDGSRRPASDLCPAREESVFASPSVSSAPPPPSGERPPTPKLNPGSWVNSSDYPIAAMENIWIGATVFKLAVGRGGRANACEILQTSGYQTLDRLTCLNLINRARFTPALTSEGVPIDGSYTNRVNWMMAVSDDSFVLTQRAQIMNSHVGLDSDVFSNKKAQVRYGCSVRSRSQPARKSKPLHNKGI